MRVPSVEPLEEGDCRNGEAAVHVAAGGQLRRWTFRMVAAENESHVNESRNVNASLLLTTLLHDKVSTFF
jgi:hypothetical protein